jgi:hypothetical protein
VDEVVKHEVKAECGACDGTGIYHGFAEPKGVGVVCLKCDGTGCATIEYTPFTGRKTRNDITTVQRSRGSFVLSCGPAGNSVSYNDFLNGKMPGKS